MRIGVHGLVIASILLMSACGSERPDQGAPHRPGGQDDGTSATTASCVEQYSLENLKQRDYAFDGTVQAIDQGADADRVTFDVHEWYKGGSGETTVRRAFGFAATTSAGSAPHSVGDRLLVAGDQDLVWECGFTQPYDAQVAQDWERAL